MTVGELPYLQEITFRMAEGTGRLDEAVRQRHAAFILSNQQENGGFANRAGESDLYYTNFALRSLAMLGALDGEPAQRAADYLRRQLSGHTAIVDFLSLIYAGMLLDVSAGIDVFSAARGDWKTLVAAEFESFRRPDGGYAKTAEGQASSMYHTFLVVISLQVIGQPVVAPQRLVDFVYGRQRDDGGFVEMGPMKRSGTNPTAAAVGLLRVLDALTPEARQDLIEFFADMQGDDGGFRANDRIPMSDVLSSFTGMLSLTDLGGVSAIDLPALDRYLRSMEHPDGGFLGGEWDPQRDVEYTFYGLGARALLALA